jgi:type IV pilus assembly protein PilE
MDRVAIPKRGSGFTLIEMMIAVLVLGVLVAIAVPIYQDLVVRSNRAEAKTILSQTSQAMERCYARFSAYDDDDCSVAFPVTSDGGNYQITEDASTIESANYTLVAVAQGRQADRDNECGNFSLSSQGVRGISSDEGTVDQCW